MSRTTKIRVAGLLSAVLLGIGPATTTLTAASAVTMTPCLDAAVVATTETEFICEVVLDGADPTVVTLPAQLTRYSAIVIGGGGGGSLIADASTAWVWSGGTAGYIRLYTSAAPEVTDPLEVPFAGDAFALVVSVGAGGTGVTTPMPGLSSQAAAGGFTDISFTTLAGDPLALDGDNSWGAAGGAGGMVPDEIGSDGLGWIAGEEFPDFVAGGPGFVDLDALVRSFAPSTDLWEFDQPARSSIARAGIGGNFGDAASASSGGPGSGGDGYLASTGAPTAGDGETGLFLLRFAVPLASADNGDPEAGSGTNDGGTGGTGDETGDPVGESGNSESSVSNGSSNSGTSTVRPTGQVAEPALATTGGPSPAPLLALGLALVMTATGLGIAARARRVRASRS